MPFFASCSRTSGLLAMIASNPRIGFAGVAAAGAAIEGCLEGIVLGAAAVAAKKHQGGRSFALSPMIRSVVSTVRTCSLSVNPVRVIRSMRANDAPD